jgi:hypothetical protein
VITKDLQVGCTTGNCKYEIVTTIFINVDSDCDGNINGDIPAGGLCFYAEGETPYIEVGAPLLWGGNIQTRISTGGGDKTVNYHVNGAEPATAITLSSLSARAVDQSSMPMALPAMSFLLGAPALGAVTWRVRRARR